MAENNNSVHQGREMELSACGRKADTQQDMDSYMIDGLKFERKFSSPEVHPYDEISWEKRVSVIKTEEGDVVNEQKDVEVPEFWSQLATDIIASKYFRRAKVPGTGREVSAKQVIDRVAKTIRQAGQDGGYFATADDAETFEAELTYLLVNQIGAFNSPTFFNCGLYHAYGISDDGGNWYWDKETKSVKKADNNFEHPQISACFIQSIEDDLMAIFDLVKQEAKIFKYGSGCTSGNSKIYVEGTGFIPIRDLYEKVKDAGREPVSFDDKTEFIDIKDLNLKTLSFNKETGKFSKDKINRVWNYDLSKEDKIRIHFDTGSEVTVSVWHPFLVWDGSQIIEKRADCLEKSDAVIGVNHSLLDVISEDNPPVINYQCDYFGRKEDYSIELTTELAWLIGYFIGNGSLSYNTTSSRNQYGKKYTYTRLRLRFFSEKEECLLKVSNIIENLFEEKASVRSSGKNTTGKELTYRGRKSTAFFNSLFKAGQKTYSVKFPSLFWTCPREIVYSFMAGLIDSDGTISDGRVLYYTASKNLAEQLTILSSIYRLGGSCIRSGNGYVLTLIHRSVSDEYKKEILKYMSIPNRVDDLIADKQGHRRAFCMKLSNKWKDDIFGHVAKKGDWLKLPVGSETFHLGRLEYENKINPFKLKNVIYELSNPERLDFLDIIASSVSFVTSVSRCEGNPDFYDLTVSNNNNYLAGEKGLVVIHNSGTNFSPLRAIGEKLSGGGTSSGLMSFLKVFDRAAGATKSGGTCLAPYQKVYTERGAVPVVELVNQDFIVLSFDKQAGRVKAKKATAFESGYKEVYELKTDKGVYHLTGDHPVLLSDGTYREVQELQPDDSIQPLSVHIFQDKYARVGLWDGNKTKEKVCRLIAQDVMGLDIDGKSVHHIDGDTSNNSPDNLKIISQSEHASLHSQELVDKGEHIFQKQQFSHAGTDNGMHSSSDFWKEPEKVRHYKETQRLIMLEKRNPKELQKKSVISKMLNTGYRLINAGFDISTFDGYIQARKKVMGRIGSISKVCQSIKKNFGSYDAYYMQLRDNNQKVEKIIPVGFMPVYDVQVDCDSIEKAIPESSHDFAISSLDEPDSCIFVHNTRRAAKMVCLDVDHPEIVDFIEWKVKEEKKVKALVDAGYSSDFDGEAYQTVSGQNSNNSVRIADEFMEAYLNDDDWSTTLRTTGEVHQSFKARELLERIAEAVWSCADPGVQFDTTINKWHTCANSGRIVASNPCSEFMFLNDSACNLASLNLVKFIKDDGSFDVSAFRHACRIFITAQEILVDLASYPTKKIAQNSHDFRPLGLGFTNLGGMLMRCGLPYDSEKGRAMASAISAIMTGTAYNTSIQLAKTKGPFERFEENRDVMLSVMKQHRDAISDINLNSCPQYLLEAAKREWNEVLEQGEETGFRNAQATLVAPTGTIGLLMDCDTTGIEPDYSLVKFKKLTGGGSFKIVNQSVRDALKTLGYSSEEIDDIITYAQGTSTLIGAPFINPITLKSKGLTDEDIAEIEKVLPSCYNLSSAFTVGVLEEETLNSLGVPEEQRNSPDFNLLEMLGYTQDQIDQANSVICGAMTLEGAPHLKEEHLAVFDCASPSGKSKRRIFPMGHVKMMAAVQPFISGAISKTVNVPNETTIEQIEQIFLSSWELGLKSIAIYRDGSKLSQPLTTEGHTTAGCRWHAADMSLQEKTGGTRPIRHRLPDERKSITHKFSVAGHEGYITVGLYEDGKPGEVFLTMAKQGSVISGLMDTIATMTSILLQYGVPLEALVRKFSHMRFEPSGFTNNKQIPIAKSIIDYVFRWLGLKFLPEEKKDTAFEQSIKELDNGMSGIEKALTTIQQEGRPQLSSLAEQEKLIARVQADAPPCQVCGAIMIRSGSCYRCLNCGATSGCS